MINIGITEILIVGAITCISILALLAITFIRLIRNGDPEDQLGEVDR